MATPLPSFAVRSHLNGAFHIKIAFSSNWIGTYIRGGE